MPHNPNPKIQTPVSPLRTETATELMQRPLPDVRMIIGDYFSAGLYCLAGAPKSGKSLLALDLSLSVAMGQMAWESTLVDSGDVLYLALEGGDRAFRQRIESMLQGEAPPDRLNISYSAEKLGGRLEMQIDLWLQQVEAPRLVVVDTYVAVAPGTSGANRFQDDYNSLSGLAALAVKWPDTLFLALHHTRKSMEGDDIMDRISGSTGMTAVTDGNALMSRATASSQCTLSIRPRNAEESEVVLERNSKTLRWSTVGTNERSQLSARRQQILEWLDSHHEGGMPADVAEALSIKPDNARRLLLMMAKSGQVRHESLGGLYLPLSREDDAA